MAQSAHPIEGTWKNQLGSELTIHSGAQSTFTGKYKTAVGNAQHVENDVTGTIIEGEHGQSIISFTVAWRNRKEGAPPSLTSWTGLFDPQTNLIDTHWTLVSNDGSSKNWSSFRTNKDTFERKN